MTHSLTYQESSWRGPIHTCQGWILRWNAPGYFGASFHETKRAALIALANRRRYVERNRGGA